MSSKKSFRSRLLRAVSGVYNEKGVSRRTRLRVVGLETKIAPATFIVDSLTDAGQGGQGMGDLRWCINEANFDPYGSDDIVFDKSLLGSSGATITLGGELPILGGVSIQVPASTPVTLVAGAKSRVFRVNIGEDREVYLQNLTIQGGTVSGDGGGVLLQGGILRFMNCNVTANSASGNGGGIAATSGFLYLDNTTVISNAADKGNGGGIASSCVTMLTKCLVSGNTALNGGGINIAGTSSYLVMNDVMLGLTASGLSAPNSASNEGGSIRMVGVSTTLRSVLTNCEITEGISNIRGGNVAILGGGAIEMIHCEISSAFLYDANSIGGGLYVGQFTGANSSLMVRDSAFGPHLINSPFSAIVTDGNAAEFGANIALEDVGAPVQINTSYILNGPQDVLPFTVFHCTRGAGVYVTGSASGTISFGNDTFSNNKADIGGAISIRNSANTVAIAKSIFGQTTVSQDTTTVNLAANVAKLGAGISVESATGKITVDSCTLNGNTASERGGGLYIKEAANFIFTNSSLTNNTATNLGGGMFVASRVDEASASSSITFTTNYVGGNTAGSGGGVAMGDGVYKMLSVVTINRSTIENNRATTKASLGGGGGGITLNRPYNVVIKNSTINNNLAYDSISAEYGLGGGIYYPNSAIDSTASNVRNCTIFGNTAAKGGGVYINCQVNGSGASTDLRLYNSTIAGNSATFEGGGIAFDNSGAAYQIMINSTVVATNTATSGPDIKGDTAVVNGQKCLIGTTSGYSLKAMSSGVIIQNTGLFSGGLAYNGGPTRTLALAVGSAAIDQGDNPLGLTYDQRDGSSPRVNGLFADIGAYETTAIDDL